MVTAPLLLMLMTPATTVPVHTSRLAARYMATFPAAQHRNLVLVIDAPGREPDVIASSARALNNTCIIRFRDTGFAAREEVVAHEVCHCATDWQDMDGRVWADHMTRAEMDVRESLADSCAARLVIRDHELGDPAPHDAHAPDGRARHLHSHLPLWGQLPVGGGCPGDAGVGGCPRALLHGQGS